MDNAEESVRRVIDRIGSGRFIYKMDNGRDLCVAISVDKQTRSATVDFTGTGPQHEGNSQLPARGDTRRRPLRLPLPGR